MNNQCYGWVVSAVRGALVVVGEHVKRSHGFSGASSARNLGGASNVSSVSDVSNVSYRHPTTYISNLGFIAVSASFTASLAFPFTALLFTSPSAHAQIIPNRAAPGAQQALVIQAANGVPVVNIQTPSAGGVSHNRYSQFDVAPQGAILNNAQDAVQTKLGGWVMGNALVAGRPASVILNEVNSPNPSQLMGTIEVAGKQAQVIVANPAGITCNGCGFINASRATLTTGEPRINAVGNLENYRVTRGLVRIDGLGMDSSSVSYTDVMARAVQINATLWAQYLRITTGVNDVNAQNTQATPIDVSVVDANGKSANPANPSPTQPPSFALDVAAIGGMYAQKIYLIGTEAGVGVRNAGLIGGYAGLGGGEIVLHANGLLENRGRIYNDHIALEAISIVNANPEGAAPVIAATERLDIAAQTIKNSEHALMVSLGDIAIGGQLDSQYHATGRAALLENASATIEAQGQLSIAANEIRNTNEHFSSDIVQASQEDIVEYGGAGAPERYREGTPDVYVFNREIDKLHTPVGTYETWSRYQYQRTIDETRITHTDPAKIIAGGDIHMMGDTLVNDKSQIVAGGQLRTELTQLINRDAQGVRTVLDKGIVTSHWRDRQKGRDNTGSSTVAYEPAKSSFGISLKAVAYEENANALVAQLSSTGTNAGSGGSSGNSGLSVENNALFRVAPQVASTTVIETDPAFTNHHQWLSSAYLLAQLSVDPTTVQKRLGDGFYEQRLVREQVAQLTGRRFLEGYASDEAQYQALLNNAATVATAFELRPGIALTAEQVKALTSDIVWLVEKDITLPNGEHTRALVPELYAKVRPGDLNANGALLSGREVILNTTQELTNSGQIIAGKSVVITGENVRNIGGQVSAKTVTIDAATDIDNIGGTLQARDALVLRAGRDITVASTTHTNETANSRRTTVDRVANLTVDNSESDGAGVLVAVAGRNLNLTAAAIVNDAKPNGTNTSNTANSATTTLIAGNDVNLTIVSEDSANHIVWDRNNQRRDSQRTDVGTRIQTQGDVQIASGHDVNLKAATVHSEQGAVNINAERNVSVAAGSSERHVDEVHQHTEHGMVSSTTRREHDVVNEQAAIGSTLSGQTVALEAGNDVRVTGSQVISTAGTSLSANNNVVIDAATNTRQVTHTYQQKTSGVMSSGGFGVTLGQRKQSENTNINSAEAAASTVASVQGNVDVHAAHSVRQTGSHIIAPAGDVNVTGERVEITEARETQRTTSDTKFKQSGLTVAVTNPVISAVQLAQHMSQAASNTSDPRMHALAAASTALAAVNAAQALQAGQGQTINGKDNQIVTATDAQGNPTATKDANAADKLGGITVSVSLGSSKSQSHSTQTADQAKGSSIAAGGDVRVIAQGAGKANDKSNKSDILIQGSKLTAGGAVVLQAEDQLTLQAAANTAQQTSTNSSQSMSVGVGFELGAKGGAGVTVAGSLGRGKANGQDLSWEETKITAGREVALSSGSDTQLNGAIVTAPKVSAEVGGDLTITSLQDTSTYRNQQQSVGGSITFGPKVTGSVNVANSNIKSDYASVDQQAGLRAGDHGFQVNVQGDTTLTGGAITSTDKAVAENKNSFSTGGQLTTSDINNQANYQADSVGVNLGVGVSPLGKYVPGGTSAGIGSDSGKSSSTTRAGISDIAGDKEARTDTNQANTSVALAKIFDADKVQKEINAQVAITQSFTYEAGKTVNNYVTAQRKALQDQLMQTSNDADQQKIVKDQLPDLNRQERVMNILIGAVAGMGSAAVAKETLSVAAEEMRKLMIVDSIKFAGVTDGKTILNNDSGSSAGMHGDGKKLGGTRIDLDLLCGADNKRCQRNDDGSLYINAEGLIEFDPRSAHVNSLDEFLTTPDGKKMAGLTGGIQGAKGTLFGVPYQAGSWQDQLVEAFAGTHDMVGGKLSGLYDEQGNATRDRSYLVKKAQDTWSASGAIVVSAPFAMSELLTPEMWTAISVLLKEAR